jgi:hypothetical protein
MTVIWVAAGVLAPSNTRLVAGNLAIPTRVIPLDRANVMQISWTWRDGSERIRERVQNIYADQRRW